jgi:hypothetical protein
MKMILGSVALLLSFSCSTLAAVVQSTSHGNNDLSGLDAPISTTDLIQGAPPSSISGIGANNGFHGAISDSDDRAPAYTDGVGDRGTGLTGLLADNDPVVDGQVIQTVEYALNGSRVDELRVFSGNFNGRDARIFSTFVFELSTDGGSSYFGLGPNGGYFASDPTDTQPGADPTMNGSTLVRVFDDTGAPLASAADFLRLTFFASGNNNPQSARDPFDGVNPYTLVDDNRPAANQSPLIWEIDVIAIPEPSTVALAGVALAGIALLRRRVR